MEDTGERLIPEGHHQTLTYGEHLSRYLTTLEVVKGKVVLDIASGAGYGTHMIAKQAKKVYGIDYSAEAIAYAKQHYGAKNIEYKVGDAHEIPLPDDSVDVVVSLETIEHLQKPAKFVAEVKRILRSGGQFIVSTPNDDEFIEGNEFHLHEFDLKELQRLITKNFEHAKFHYQGSYFGAALLDEETFTKGGSWSGKVEKTFGQPKTKAIYYLAIASDQPVPSLAQTVALADAWSTKDDIERDAIRRKEADRLHAELGQLRESEQYNRNKAEALEQERDALNEELHAIKTSKGWRMLKKAYTVKSKLKP
jgi:ubiquinone/menaquinone biosynthesis C-methylase UbiE